MSASEVQVWVTIIGSLVTASIAILTFFNYRTRRDRAAAVGSAFSSTVDGLAGERATSQIAAAVLLRRFFDAHTEQGRGGRPYREETVNLIAGALRDEPAGTLQKTLADGLRYARDLKSADLQQCNLSKAYLGVKAGDTWRLDLSHADLFEANLEEASLKEVIAEEAVFYQASLRNAVLEDAVLTSADFREADLEGARFAGAQIGGARFARAKNVPNEVGALLDEHGVAAPGVRVPPRPRRS